MFFLFHALLSFLEVIISTVGVVIVVVGFARCGALLMPSFFLNLESNADLYKKARFLLAQYILLGLEFMVASDVIYTVIARDYESLIILVALVAVRTLFAFSLEREIREE